MPEATVGEENGSVAGKNEIGLAGNFLHVQAITETQCMQTAS